MNKRRQLLLASLAGTDSSVFAAESGVGDGEILLGQSAVLSGPLGPAMQGFNAGAKLAFENANDKGGIAGRKVRLISLDDELKPERTVANYKTLLAEHKVLRSSAVWGRGRRLRDRWRRSGACGCSSWTTWMDHFEANARRKEKGLERQGLK